MPATTDNHVDEANRVLSDILVCEEGEAKGHDFYIDRVFCEAVAEFGNQLGSVKVRLNHPEGRGDVLSIIGEASDFYVADSEKDGKATCCTRARTLKVFDLPGDDGGKIVALAKQASSFFGMSIDAVIKLTKRTIGGVKVALCEKLNAIDFVDSPAATPALFSAKDGVGAVRIACGVDFTANTEIENTNKDFMATEKKLAEEKKDEKKPEITMAELAERLGKLEASMSKLAEGKDEPEKKDEKKVEAADEPEKKDAKKHDEPDGDENLSAKVEQMAAKAFTSLLAKVGAKHIKLSEDTTEVKTEAAPKLTEEQKAIAVKLGIDPKAYAANIAAESQRVAL